MKDFIGKDMLDIVGFVVVTFATVVAIVATVFLFVGCINPVDKSTDYENARRATIKAWEEVIGKVSDRCYNRSIDAMVVETGRFPESCMPPLEFGTYIGCYMPTGIFSLNDNIPTEILGLDGDMIFIYEGRTEQQRLDTAVHEFGHLLHFCETSGTFDIDYYISTFHRCAEEILVYGEPSSDCEIPGDYFHLDDRMWDRIQTEQNGYGTRTVEAIGCANLEF